MLKNSDIELGNCIECGKEYSITYGEMMYFKDKSIPLPKRCIDCRKNKKERNQNDNVRVNNSWNNRSYKY